MTHAKCFDSLKRRIGQQRGPDELKVICDHAAWSAVQHHTVLRLHLGQQGVPGCSGGSCSAVLGVSDQCVGKHNSLGRVTCVSCQLWGVSRLETHLHIYGAWAWRLDSLVSAARSIGGALGDGSMPIMSSIMGSTSIKILPAARVLQESVERQTGL